ncbi:MAG: MBL fold metallo-hydrolase [Candidatus Pacebacteria bacterium]|nr:MBL fold metallo-hydrolase [Candidatus Paceibacterota bacterium]MDD4074119.1 MBL fold metallo-hydrolase [Candidatus Paceibacterota bacterium]
MKINWCGDSCFEINSISKEKENILTVIDPKVGKKFDKADIILETHSKENGFKTGEQFVVSSCGEYERKEIFIQGINSLQLDKKKNIIYTVEAEGIRICHLGYLGQNELDEEQMTEIGNIDILMVPIDGDKTISYSEAVKIISLIQPSIIIPMCYDKKGLEPFLKAMGEKEIEPKDKLNIQRKNISSSDEKAEIIILEEK